jgi:hypothetical protein
VLRRVLKVIPPASGGEDDPAGDHEDETDADIGQEVGPGPSQAARSSTDRRQPLPAGRGKYQSGVQRRRRRYVRRHGLLL